MGTQPKRMVLMLKDNVEKIIEDGIKPNLSRLNQCSKFLKSNPNISKEKLWKENLTARSAIQHLRANLSQLEKCYMALKEIENYDYEPMILAIKDEASRDIETFQQTNGAMMDLNVKHITDISTEIDESRNNSSLQTQQQQKQKCLDDELSLDTAKQRMQDVENINQDLQDLQDLLNQFGNLVYEQKTQVDQIEANIETAAVNVHEGTKSLAKAASSSIVPIACAAVGASIFGPIGALVSFKISTGLVSAIGGSVATYGLASYWKKKKAKEAQLELEMVAPRPANDQS